MKFPVVNALLVPVHIVCALLPIVGSADPLSWWWIGCVIVNALFAMLNVAVILSWAIRRSRHAR